jgi:single-strand DNA-binding protein
MADINNITLTGRLVQDPVVNQRVPGQCLGSFTLASNYRYTNRLGDARVETAFVPCKAFGSWAKNLEQRKKGDPVVVTGRLRTEKWEQDGKPRSQLALVCESVRFLADQRLEPGGTGEGIPF